MIAKNQNPEPEKIALERILIEKMFTIIEVKIKRAAKDISDSFNFPFSFILS